MTRSTVTSVAETTPSHRVKHSDSEARKPDCPDYAGIGACVAAGVLVLSLSWFKLSSPDIGYHIAYGRDFLKTGKIVDLDPHLYPEVAKPFINANWGSQIVMSLAEKFAGATGLIALRIPLIATIFACILGIVRRLGGGWLAVAMAWILAALAGYERFSMRPELFSYAIMMLMVVLHVRGIFTRGTIALLVILQFLWVNLHSYFLVGPMLTSAFLVQAAWDAYRVKRSGLEDRRNRVTRLKCVGITLGLQIAACVANPWHIHGAIFPIKTVAYLKSHEAMGGTTSSTLSAWSEISEFRSPFSFAGERILRRTIYAYVAILGVTALGAVAMGIQGRLGQFLVVSLLLVMSLQMRRNIAQFAFVAAPLTITAMTTLGVWGRLSSRMRSLSKIFVVILMVVSSGYLSWNIYNGRFYYAERRISREFGAGYSEKAFPIRACNWIKQHQDQLKENLFVDYFASSNAIPWLPERFKLYVDTNTFAYAESTLSTAFKLGKGEIAHAPFFEKYAVNIALLRCGPDTQLLVKAMMKDRGEWSLVYFDEYYVIFVRRIAAHIRLIVENEKTQADLDVDVWLSKLEGAPATKALTMGTMVGVPHALGWNEAAVLLAEAAVRLSPDYDEGWNYLGVSELNLGNAAARKPDYVNAHRHWKKAINCFERAINLNPGHAEARVYLAATRAVLEELNNRSPR